MPPSPRLPTTIRFGVHFFCGPHYLPVRIPKRQVGVADLHALGPYLPRMFV
jgi:hypothetical protein